ncbi:MAG: hypothetical protein ACLSWS_13520 [Faecalispora jeddahensis]
MANYSPIEETTTSLMMNFLHGLKINGKYSSWSMLENGRQGRAWYYDEILKSILEGKMVGKGFFK